ncbi:MAG: VapC toxin family PIN domain ribonuclease [Rubrivivax sp.]
MALPRALIDTGPLVAWFDADDRHHAAVAAFMAGFAGELVSTWPVLTEVCHLLPARMVPAFMRWTADGGLDLLNLPTAALVPLADRMDKYADLPMDMADASLVWAAETMGVMEILTLDRRDFGVYRTAQGRALKNLLEEGGTPAPGRSRGRRSPRKRPSPG